MPSRLRKTTAAAWLSRQHDEFRTVSVFVERQLAVGNDYRRTGPRELCNCCKYIVWDRESIERLSCHLHVERTPLCQRRPVAFLLAVIERLSRNRRLGADQPPIEGIG